MYAEPQEECDLPAGGHLRNRRIMEQEVGLVYIVIIIPFSLSKLRGHKQGKLDLLDSFNTFYLQKNRLPRDPDQITCSGVRASKLSAGGLDLGILQV